MPFESEYKLEDVAATPVPADKIDATFRSSTIGQFHLLLLLFLRQCGDFETFIFVLPVEGYGRHIVLHCAPSPRPSSEPFNPPPLTQTLHVTRDVMKEPC
jgi:hypothetical protein